MGISQLTLDADKEAKNDKREVKNSDFDNSKLDTETETLQDFQVVSNPTQNDNDFETLTSEIE